MPSPASGRVCVLRLIAGALPFPCFTLSSTSGIIPLVQTALGEHRRRPETDPRAERAREARLGRRLQAHISLLRLHHRLDLPA